MKNISSVWFTAEDRAERIGVVTVDNGIFAVAYIGVVESPVNNKADSIAVITQGKKVDAEAIEQMSLLEPCDGKNPVVHDLALFLLEENNKYKDRDNKSRCLYCRSHEGHVVGCPIPAAEAVVVEATPAYKGEPLDA